MPLAGTDAAGTTGAWNVHYQVDGVNGESLTPSMGATRLNFNSGGTGVADFRPPTSPLI
jgi:flagellar hook protein FlgE